MRGAILMMDYMPILGLIYILVGAGVVAGIVIEAGGNISLVRIMLVSVIAAIWPAALSAMGTVILIQIVIARHR